MRISKPLILIATILLIVGIAVSGQSLAGLGAINGVVKDATGAIVPGARVVVANPQTGLRRNLESNEVGLFSAPSLTPGSGYEVSVAKEGFAPYTAKDIQIQVGQNVTLTVVMQVQQQVQEITITEATPLVDSTKTGVSQVVDDKQISELPINGRRVDTFVLLTPGVTEDGTFGLLTFRGIPGGNAFLTDGNDTTQQYYNENAGRTRISSNLSQDAVQEFQVQSSGMTAEFGRAAGGSVNTVTKSGTNDTHGTAYWFFRNHSLNARDRYALTNPKEVRHQFGGSLGGAIRKDKLFYFLNTDVTRRDFPLYSTAQNPQLFTPDGRFIGQCAAPATAQQCQNAIGYFSRFFGIIPRTANQETYFAKLDFRPNESHSLSLSFNLMNWVSPNGIQTQASLTTAAGVGNNGDSTVRHRFARLAHTWILAPNVVNEFRFGWFKDRLYDTLNPELAPPNGLLGQLSVQGQGNLGVATFLPRVQPTEDRFQFANNLTWLKGRHNYKFGFDFAHARDQIDLLNEGRGSYTYDTFTNFALDLTNLDGGKRWQRYSQTFGDPYIKFYVRDFNFFAQDQWRLASRLTLNYGVRYEYAQFAQPKISNPHYPQTGSINQPATNFAPRVGFAYSIDDAGKSIIRAGYGIFFARMPGALIGNLMQNNAVVQKAVTLQNTAADRAIGPVFPAFLPAIDRPASGTVSLGFATPDLATPYTQQWDFGYERQLAKDLGVTVSYLGSRGVKFFLARDLNIGAPGAPVTYSIRDANGNQVGVYSTPTYRFANRVDTRYGRVSILEGAGQTWYNALVIQVRKRGRYMQGSLAYTWSHAQDLNQGAGNNNLFISSDPVRTLSPVNYRDENKGTSPLDQRHRLVMTGILMMPQLKNAGTALKTLAGDWQLSMIATIASPRYDTPQLAVIGTPFTGAAWNGSLNGYDGDRRAPFEARTSIPIDSVARMDARLSKYFRLTERQRLMLGFEGFNIFGNVSDTSVNNRAYEARNGVITPVVGLGAGRASQGFPDGTNARRAQAAVRYIF